MSDKAVDIHVRPEFENDNLGMAENVDIERPLSVFERIANINAVRKFSILLGSVSYTHLTLPTNREV